MSSPAQQSDEWLEWRKKGIGASDAPIIMKASPWKTPFQLWQEKTGRVSSKQGPNWAQQRGINLEPEARSFYELKYGLEMPPTLVVHPTHSFLRASLDGINIEKRTVLEIKCPGKEDHMKAVAQQIPEKYVWQLVHQLLVTDLDLVHYLSYYEKSGELVEFKRDKKKEELLFKEVSEFWKCVEKDTPPDFIDRDFVTIKNKDAVDLFVRYKELKNEYDDLDEKLKEAKESLIKLSDGKRIQCSGVRVVPVISKGAVDYSKVPQLVGVDLEPFRKKAVVSTRITISKC